MRDSVANLRPAGAFDRSGLAAALRALAAVADRDHLDGPATGLLRAEATRLDGTTAGDGAVFELKRALLATLDAADLIQPRRGWGAEFNGAKAMATTSARALDGASGRVHQREPIARALRALTNVLFLIEGVPRPFDKPDLVAAEPPEASVTFASSVAQAHTAIGLLRTAPIDRRREFAANAFAAWAAALSCLPRGEPPPDAQVAILRVQVGRLHGATYFTFDKVAWLIEGLTAALDGLQIAQTPDERTREKPWIETARAAIADLKGSVNWSFQPAPIQDAFRAVNDVFLLQARDPPAG